MPPNLVLPSGDWEFTQNILHPRLILATRHITFSYIRLLIIDLISTVPFLLLAIWDTSVGLLVTATLTGISSDLFGVGTRTFLQMNTNEEYLGRVLGFYNIALALGAIPVVAILTWFSRTFTTQILSIIALVISVLVALFANIYMKSRTRRVNSQT